MSLEGVVVGPDGSPVPEARVFAGYRGALDKRGTVASSNGHFSLPGCKPGTNLLSAEAPGFATTTIRIDTTRHGGPYQLLLRTGRQLLLRTVKQNGEPISGAWLGYDGLRRSFPIDEPFPVQAEFDARTDTEGRAVWEHSAAGELNFHVFARGFMRRLGVSLNTNETEHSITLLPALKVAGRVLDHSNGQPIQRFHMVCGYPRQDSLGGPSKIQWNGLERFWRDFDKPEFEAIFDEPLTRLWTESELPNPGYVLKFESKGYAPFVTRFIRPDEIEAHFEVRLRAATANLVTVLLPSGQPAEDAEVFLASRTVRLISHPGRFTRRYDHDAVAKLRTDAQGRFRLEPDSTVTHLVIVHAGGYAETTPAWLASSTTVQLQALGRIEGALTSNGLPAAGRRMLLQLDGGQTTPIPTTDRIEFETNDRGEFVLPQVPAGHHGLIRLAPQHRNGKETWVHVPLGDVEVGAGEMKRVALDEGVASAVR